MRFVRLAVLACAAALVGCMPSHRLHEHGHVQEWDSGQAREVLRASLQYAGARDIHVGCGSFSFAQSSPGPFVDACERIEVPYDDIEWIEMGVTQVEYRVVVHQRSRGGAAVADLAFASRRTARNCADALATLSHP